MNMATLRANFRRWSMNMTKKLNKQVTMSMVDKTLKILIVLLIISMMLLVAGKAQAAEQEAPLENIKKTEQGYLISQEDIIELANYIKEMETKVGKLEAKVQTLEEVLAEERKYFDNKLSQANELIALQNQQIKDYKEMYQWSESKMSLKDKLLLVAAGVAISQLF